MGGVTVRPVAGAADLRTWITFPREHVYASSSQWVPPQDADLRRYLDPRKDPFFHHGAARPLLARDAGGRVTGRALAHIYHPHNVRHGERAAFYGYFEALDDQETATALVDAAAAFGAEHGCAILRGPFNMTAMQEMGILVDGFDAAPAVDETYTAPYYPTLLAGAGLCPTFPVTTFRVDDLAAVDPESLLNDRHRALLAGGRVRVRHADMRHFAAEIETLRDLLNDSFYENPYFVPITHDEFFFQLGPYRRLMDPAISVVAEMDGVPCGFIVTVPDYNPLLKRMGGKLGPSELITFLRGRAGIRDAVLIIMGVQRQLQGRGLMRILQAEHLRALRRRGYRRLTITWVADANEKSLATCRAIGGRPLHRLTLYEGAITPEGRIAR